MPTYYVDGAVGNDGNAGTSEGAGNAWATIDHAMNNVAAGDTVYIKATGTYNELVTIDTPGSNWTTLSIEFIGYTTTITDNGKVTINGTTNCLNTSLVNSNMYYRFKNIKFTNASSSGVDLIDDQLLVFSNCEFTGNGSRGAYVDWKTIFINCISANNTFEGFQVATNSITYAMGCIAYGNNGHGFFGFAVAYKCLAYANGFTDDGFSSCVEVIACTADGDGVGNDGILSANIAIDNIVYDFNVVGITTSIFDAYNLVNGNTTDYAGAPYLRAFQDVTSAPAFTDEAGDDYRPSSSSPAVDAQLKPGGIT